MDRPQDFDTWPMNEKIKYLHTIEKLNTIDICLIVNRTMGHVCNIISNGFPPSKRKAKWLGDEGHSGVVAVTKADRNDYMRHRLYGLTIDQYQAMIQAQDNKCIICQEDMKNDPQIDHVHGSNPPIVRALLCIGCNTGIGSLQESPELFERAIRYIMWHATKRPT